MRSAFENVRTTITPTSTNRPARACQARVQRACDEESVSARLRPRALATPRRIVSAAAVAILMLAAASPAAAYPNMIRLGYPTCASCHVSPQGGGVLTRYGKGIDLAQTMRAEEPYGAEATENAGWSFLYDNRSTMSIDRDPKSETEYGFGSSFRMAVGHEKHKVVYAFAVRSPTLARTRRMGAASMGMSRLYYTYQPREGLALVVGRDDLPTGLGSSGMTSYARRVNNPSVSSAPTQVKLFWWNKQWQIATYGYGPDGLETQPQFESRGAGAVVGYNVWKDRAVVGLTGRVSKADAFDRNNAGMFVRLGLTENFGVLAEHDVTSRTVNTGRQFTHLAGHVEVFYVPVNWLHTALAVQHLNTTGGASTYRLTPSVELRLTGNVRLDFSMRHVYQDIDSRVYSIGLQFKTQ
jgi:hypothetical protein